MKLNLSSLLCHDLPKFDKGRASLPFTTMKACDLVVRIVYEPAKMSLMTSLSKKDMLIILRKELDAMKLPHPPELNVQPPTSEGLTFFWTTYADSVPLVLALYARKLTAYY